MALSIQSNLQDLIDEIKKRGAQKVMLQLPEGLKTNTTEITTKLEEAGIECVVSNNPSYGACDLADREAKQFGCDMLVHIGHSKFYADFKTAVPVLYYPWVMDVESGDVDFSVIKEKRIGIITNIQHLHLLDSIKRKLEEKGKTAFIGGQVLGCWYANAEKIVKDVDCFLFVGSGVFHSLGLKTEKPVYALDLEKMRIEPVDLTLLEKRRYAHIFNARNAKSFAILVSSKAGQNNLIGKAENVAAYLKQRDKKAYILVMDEISDKKLMGIKVDAFINTACPRLLDDSWSKPFINANDVEKIFEE
jgi:2-(3-amino-3-carboxypropyl)histidine synthase